MESLNPSNNSSGGVESLEIEKILALASESTEYKGKYPISNWDFEYAQEHYERDVIMAFHKSGSPDYAIDKALDKIRQKLDTAGVSLDWSKPINLQEVVNLYRKHTDDENRGLRSLFETSGVFSIERLGYEELRDQILMKTPPLLRSVVDKKIKQAIEQKLERWKVRRESVEI